MAAASSDADTSVDGSRGSGESNRSGGGGEGGGGSSSSDTSTGSGSVTSSSSSSSGESSMGSEEGSPSEDSMEFVEYLPSEPRAARAAAGGSPRSPEELGGARQRGEDGGFGSRIEVNFVGGFSVTGGGGGHGSLAELADGFDEQLAENADPSEVDPVEHGREKAAGALAQLTCEEEACRQLAAAGGLPLLVQILRDGTEDAKECAAEALFNLSERGWCRGELLRAGAVQALRSLLGPRGPGSLAWSGHHEALDFAEAALENLTSTP